VLGGDADEPLEVAGEVALVPEPGSDGDLGQREVIPAPQQLLGAFDAADDDVLMGGKPVEVLNSRAEW
jgi:hypothetical protein